MREIKFRAWYGLDQKFYYWRADEDYPLDGFYGAIGPIEQLTGLQDINGKDIYEGDLCKAYKSNSSLNGIYEVAWHKNKGRWYYKNQPTYKDLYQVGCSGNSKCEIVGNIHEANNS